MVECGDHRPYGRAYCVAWRAVLAYVMLKDRCGEPVFPSGALWRAIFIVVAFVTSYYLRDLIAPTDRPKVMPSELREAAAHCILTRDDNSCSVYEAAKPDYPIAPNRAGR